MDCYEYFKTFKTPTADLPMKAKQAAALAEASYQKIYEDSVQDNLMRWKDNAIKSIDAAASFGNYNTSMWIYKSTGYAKTEAFGLDDFCEWLRGFGYDVSTDDSRIYISWEVLK